MNVDVQEGLENRKAQAIDLSVEGPKRCESQRAGAWQPLREQEVYHAPRPMCVIGSCSSCLWVCRDEGSR